MNRPTPLQNLVNPFHPRPRRRSRRNASHAAAAEIFEVRKLLSAVMATGDDLSGQNEQTADDQNTAPVAYGVRFMHPTGSELSRVDVGDEFIIEIHAEQTSAEGFGLFSAYADATFDEELVEVLELINPNERGGIGSLDSATGLIDEAGAINGFDSTTGGLSDSMILIQLRVRAVSEGILNVQTEPADGLFHETVVLGLDQDLRNVAEYGSASLQIGETSGQVRLDRAVVQQNELTLKYDVTGGSSSPIDVTVRMRSSASESSIVGSGRIEFAASLETGTHSLVIDLNDYDVPESVPADGVTHFTVQFGDSDEVRMSGVFQDSEGTLHVFGTDGDDVISSTIDELQLADSTGTGVTASLSGVQHIHVQTYDGNDRVGLSTATADVFANTGAGDDSVETGAGDDFVFAGAGNDLVFGGAGNDRLIGAADNDEIDGGDGDDFVAGSAGQDSLRGGAGNDEVMGNGSAGDSLSGGLGDDTLDGGKGGDFLVESADVDLTLVDGRLTGLGTDTLIGIEGAKLSGGSGSNVIDASGFGASVTVYGGGGHDTLIGTANNDMLFGESGRDELIGGDGNDRLDGGGSGDRLFGQAGNDRLLGRGGHDDLYGGDGDDSLFGHAGTDTIHAETTSNLTLKKKWLFGQGRDRIRDIEQAVLTGNDNDNRLDARLFQGSGGVTLHGGAGNDFLRGSKQADEVFGDSGDDRIFGLAGSDLIAVGRGIDQVDGGAGHDVLMDYLDVDSADRIFNVESATDASLAGEKVAFADIDQVFSQGTANIFS